jgi:hypothetical protein
MRLLAAAALALTAGCGFQTSSSDDLAPPADLGACDGPCKPEILAQNLVLPVDIAVNDTYVYWLEYGPQTQGLEGTVTRVRKSTGCAQADLGCLDLLANCRFRLESMTLGPSEVCWIEYYEYARDVMCESLTSGAIRHVAQNQPYADRLATAGLNLVWVTGANGPTDGGGAVMGQSIANANPLRQTITYIGGRSRMSSVTAEPNVLYWSEVTTTSTGGVWAVALSDGGVRPILQGSGTPMRVVTFSDYVFWTDLVGGSIMRARKDGSDSPAPIATGRASPLHLAVDASGVYWIDLGTIPNYLDGVVMRADLDGANAAPLAQNIPIGAALALDSDYVYWAQQGTPTANYTDGAIVRIHK